MVSYEYHKNHIHEVSPTVPHKPELNWDDNRHAKVGRGKLMRLQPFKKTTGREGMLRMEEMIFPREYYHINWISNTQ